MITINVMDANFERKAVINTYLSLTWEEDYKDKGGFRLSMGDEAAQIADIGDYLVITGVPTAMIILSKEIISNLRQVLFSGFTTLYILSKRIAREQVAVTGAEAGIRKLIGDNLRGLSNFALSGAKGFADTFEMTYQWIEVLEAITEIVKNTTFGMRMLYDRIDKRHVFDLYQGLDRSAGQSVNTRAFFGEEFKNIYNLRINDDTANFKNYAYVTGGDEENPVVVEVGTATGNDRYEVFVSGADVKLEDNEDYNSQAYKNRLRDKGVTALSDYIRRQNFEIEVDPEDYGIKYSMGDTISCKSTRYGVQLSAKIMKRAIIIENNTKKIELTVGDAKLDAIGEIKLWS